MRRRLTAATTLLLLLLVFSSSSIKLHEKQVDPILKLEALGYFKYTEAGKLEEFKSLVRESLQKHGVLPAVSDDETLLPYDYRLYFCDGEALFEEGGLKEYLQYAKHAFERRGLKLEWANETSDQKGQFWRHGITVNGKEYVAFEGNMDRLNVWGIAQLNFYRLLNDQLKLQGSDERIYPISGGEDGQFLFLTDELYQYITRAFYNGSDFRKWDIPYPVEKWREVHSLN